MSRDSPSRRLPRVCAAVLAALAAVCPPAAGSGTAVLVIVHADNPVNAVTREELSRIFLKKSARWPGGAEAVPLDLAPGVAVRGRFSREVLGKTVRAVQAYWKQQLFSGKSSPPPELATEAEMVAAVRANPLAVGYVSDEASLSGVKVIDVLDASPPAAQGL